MHRLVQMSTLGGMSEVNRAAIFNTVVDLLWRGYPRSQASSDTLAASWDICTRYNPHLLRLAKLQREWDLPVHDTEKLFSLLFNYSW